MYSFFDRNPRAVLGTFFSFNLQEHNGIIPLCFFFLIIYSLQRIKLTNWSFYGYLFFFQTKYIWNFVPRNRIFRFLAWKLKWYILIRGGETFSWWKVRHPVIFIIMMKEKKIRLFICTLYLTDLNRMPIWGAWALRGGGAFSIDGLFDSGFDSSRL